MNRLIMASAVCTLATLVYALPGAPAQASALMQPAVGCTTSLLGFPPVPIGFDPLTASNAQLTRYGFPSRPTGGAALQSWETAMQDAHVEVCTQGATTTAALPSGTQVTTTRSAWAGYEADSQSNSHIGFTQVQATWAASPINGNSNYSTYKTNDPMVGFWVGLGGSTTTSLVQAGILEVATATPQYRFFTQAAPGQTTPDLRGPVVNAGDEVYVSVSASEYYLGPAR